MSLIHIRIINYYNYISAPCLLSPVPSESSPPVPVPVCPVYLSMDRTIVISYTVDPIIGIWQDRGNSPGEFSLVPHQRLQLAKLLPKVRIGRREGLGDGGVPGPHMGLRSSIQVSITFQRTDKVTPKPCLM